MLVPVGLTSNDTEGPSYCRRGPDEYPPQAKCGGNCCKEALPWEAQWLPECRTLLCPGVPELVTNDTTQMSLQRQYSPGQIEALKQARFQAFVLSLLAFRWRVDD